MSAHTEWDLLSLLGEKKNQKKKTGKRLLKQTAVVRNIQRVYEYRIGPDYVYAANLI